jgi:hypothetical protein
VPPKNNKNHSTGEEEFFCRPDPATTRNMKPHNYGKIGQSGFAEDNAYVEPGDVIIGKCMPQKQGHMINNKDTSVALKSNERGFVDRNCYGHRHFTNVTGDGYTFAKVRSFSLAGEEPGKMARGPCSRAPPRKQKLDQNGGSAPRPRSERASGLMCLVTRRFDFVKRESRR